MGKTALFSRKQAGGMFSVVDESESTGNNFFVDSGSATGSDAVGYGQNPDAPFLTLDYAIGQCTANNGDRIFVMAGHAETLATAGAVAADVAGIQIIGQGSGSSRPTFTFSNTAATIAVSAASISIKNIVIKPSIDSVVSPIVVSAADCTLDIEVQDASSTVECVRAVLTTAAADRLKLKLKYLGDTGGNAVVNAVRLVGCNNADLDIDFFGVASTGIVEFLTTACTNVNIKGTFYNSGTTDGTKNVIDTVGGSTWGAVIWDSSAGKSYSGGSGAALASDDVSAVAADVTTVLAQLSGGAGIATWPASAAPANGVSLAEALRYLDDAVQGSNGVVTFPSGAAAANGVSLAEVLRYIQDQIINGTGTVLDTNTSLYGVLAGATGIPTFPAAAAPANSVSLAEVIRAIYDRQLGNASTASANSLLGTRVTKATADTIDTAAVPLFTVAGGRVLVTAIFGKVTTIIQAQATNTKLQFNPTTGTTNDICANLDINADEVGSLYSISGVASDAMLRSKSGAIRNMSSNGLILDVGDVEQISGAASTGSIQWTAYYIPLDDGATLAAA